MENHADLTARIIGAAIAVHKKLGPGFLESVYRRALQVELARCGLRAESDAKLSVTYDQIVVGEFIPDLLVESHVVIELKASSALTLAHEVQTVNYLTVTGIEVGLLLGFGGVRLEFKRKHPHRHAHYRPVHPVSARPVHPVPSLPAMNSPPNYRIIDISRPLYTGSPHWPGDSATALDLTASMAAGAACNVGRLSCSVHNGTHLDAPFHYNSRGLTTDQLDLSLYVGPARVIDARGHPTFTPALFHGLTDADLAAVPRILFRTDAWSDLTTFPTVWPLLDRALPAWLAARGVKLIGLDLPSVDELNNKDMAIHHLLDDAGILIIESLDLRDVEAGVYELIALPLKLRGGDGSPIRAILRR